MKKLTITILLITLLLLSGCVNKPTANSEEQAAQQIKLKDLGTAGRFDEEDAGYEILELTDLDAWVLYVKRDKLSKKLGVSQDYTVKTEGYTYKLKNNPFNDNILKLLLPLSKKPEDITTIQIQPATARAAGELKDGTALSIEKIFITKAEKNGTTLNAISMDDYTTLYPDADKNNFAYEGGTFIHPSHVVSNEENAYTKNTYFDARAAANTHNAAGAFDFLKSVADYESHIVMEDPNRFSIDGAATQLLAPEQRWRVRELGNAVFNLIDDAANQQFILSINKDTLPSTYNGTIFWTTQVKEATQVSFDKENANSYNATITYTDAPSKELVLNSRFEGLSDKILRFDANGTFKKGYTNLNTAISEVGNADLIKIADGTTLTPTNEAAKFEGNIPIQEKELSVSSFYGNPVILDVAGTAQGFIISNSTVTFKNLKIMNGVGAPHGGAFLSVGSNLSVISCEFASHTGIAPGGAISNHYGPISIEESTFTFNQCVMAAAIYNEGGNLTINHSCFASNSTQDPSIVNSNSGHSTITNSTFRNNTAVIAGGALMLMDNTFYVDNCLFDSNKLTTTSANSYNGYGSGVFVFFSGNKSNTIKNSVFKNMAARRGAGIAVLQGELTIYNNTFENLNASETGAAVYLGAGSKKNGTDIGVANFAIPYNSSTERWNIANAPAANITFVENTTQADNTYTNCSINGNAADEGAKIGWVSRVTPAGTLSLRPLNSGIENELVSLFVDYEIGTAYQNASITFDVPSGFEITSDASVIVDGISTAASIYNPTSQSITVTGITLGEGTVTLKLKEQAIPNATTHESMSRNVDYVFKATGDLNGTGNIWVASQGANVTFESIKP